MGEYIIIPRHGAYHIARLAWDGSHRMIERYDPEDAVVEHLRDLKRSDENTDLSSAMLLPKERS